MKTITKASYITLLIMGLLISGITILHLNRPDLFARQTLNYITAALALISGILAGMISAMNPAQKWSRLRGAALAIESEVWRFRTRSGIYVENSEKDTGIHESSEQILKARVETIKLQVLKSAGLLNTYFMSMFEYFGEPKNPNLFGHGQYKDCRLQGSFGNNNSRFSSKASAESAKRLLKGSNDDFHSPVRPNDYLQYRVRPVLAFYQSRLPVYHRIKSSVNTFLIIGTFSGTALALNDLATWAAIPAAVVGGVTAWSEFSNTEDKLTRYSDAITQIDSIIMWWGMLSAVDQSSVSSISELIERCETVFRDERQAWVSLNIEQKKSKLDEKTNSKGHHDEAASA